MSSRSALLAAALVLPFAVLQSCGHGSTHGAEAASVKPAEKQPVIKDYPVEPVRTVQAAVDEVEAPAKIEANPNRVSHVSVPVSGRITEVFAKLGDTVQEGQILLNVESQDGEDAESAYLQTSAAITNAEANLSKTEADLARVSDLFQNNAVAKKEVLNAETAVAQAKAALGQAKAARTQAMRKLEILGLKPGVFGQKISVRAPLTGKVLEIHVVAGEFRNDMTAPLLTIADLSRLWVSSQVPESRIRFCRVGHPVRFEMLAFPGENFHAVVSHIADTVDAQTRTVMVRAEVDNRNGRFRPDMFGHLRSAAAAVRAVPWVNEASIVEIRGQPHVFVETRPGQFAAKAVVVGKRHESGFTVTAGLQPGDRVVTQGAIYLKGSM